MRSLLTLLVIASVANVCFVSSLPVQQEDENGGGGGPVVFFPGATNEEEESKNNPFAGKVKAADEDKDEDGDENSTEEQNSRQSLPDVSVISPTGNDGDGDSGFFFGGGASEEDPDVGVDVAIKSEEQEEEEEEAGLALPALPADLLANCTLDQLSLPHQDPLTLEWSCHFLTETGPCLDDDHWFVLSRPDLRSAASAISLADEGEQAPAPRLTGVCAERECVDTYVLFQDECVEIGTRKMCPKGMVMLVNPFGEGECDCLEGYLPHSPSESNSQFLECYREFSQGPCDDGFQFVLEDAVDVEAGGATGLNSLANPRGAVCVRPNCTEEGQLLYKGKCVSGTLNCTDQEMVVFDPEANEVSCEVAVRQLFILPESCPDGEALDHEGVCRKIIKFGGQKLRANPNDVGDGQEEEKSRPPRRLATTSWSLQYFLKLRFLG